MTWQRVAAGAAFTILAVLAWRAIEWATVGNVLGLLRWLP